MGVVEARSPTNCQVLVRGEIKDKGAEVPRGVLTVLKTPATTRINPRRSGRLELAQWIASKEQPAHRARDGQSRLGASVRARAGRIGRQLRRAWATSRAIPSCSTRWPFQFMNEGWSVKKLIRSIVLSHTYQLSSEHNAARLRT